MTPSYTTERTRPDTHQELCINRSLKATTPRWGETRYSTWAEYQEKSPPLHFAASKDSGVVLLYLHIYIIYTVCRYAQYASSTSLLHVYIYIYSSAYVTTIMDGSDDGCLWKCTWSVHVTPRVRIGAMWCTGSWIVHMTNCWLLCKRERGPALINIAQRNKRNYRIQYVIIAYW